MKTNIVNHQLHHFPCSCNDWHYIKVMVDGDDVSWRYLEIADAYAPLRWRDRVVAAGKLLRGKPHYHGGILLDEANARDLKVVIDSLIGEVDGD